MQTIRKALPFLLIAAVAFWTFTHGPAHPIPARAQTTSTPYDCSFTYHFVGSTASPAQANNSTSRPCVAWRVTYTTSGFSSVTVQFETSPDSSSWTVVPNTACSATVQPPCFTDGASPITAGVSGTAAYRAYDKFVRVNVSSVSSTGSGDIVVYGYKGTSASAGLGGGGSPGPPGPTGATGATGATGPPGPSSAQLTYYFTNTNSDIATYLQQTATPVTPKVTHAYTALTAGTHTLQNWATNPGIPNLTFIPAGTFEAHIHAARTLTAGTVLVYAQIWEVASTGVDIAMIGQTGNSALLTTSEIEYNLDFSTANVYTMVSSASRIDTRVFAVVTGVAGPDVNLYVGGTADPHTALPGNTVDVTNFVPYTGATSNVDLAAFNLASNNGIVLNGGTGTAKIQPANAQGTPNPIQFPTTTGTAGNVLSTDGGNPQQLSWIAPGSGGLSASGFYLNSGSNYYIGPTFQPATLPSALAFTWENQGTASEAAVGNALVLTVPGGTSTTSWHNRIQTIAPHSSVTAALIITQEMLNYRAGAIIFRESGTGKISTFGLFAEPVGSFLGNSLVVNHYTNDTTFNSNVYQSVATLAPFIWLKLEISGANLNYYFSIDGINFILIFTETKTAFFTVAPDQWGYSLNNEQNLAGRASAITATLLSWNPL